MKKTVYMAVTLLLVFFVLACATAPAPSLARDEATDSPLYYGSGQGPSQTAAIDAAKRVAVRAAAQDAVGIASAAANKDKLEQALSGNINAFVYNDTMELIDRGGAEGDFSITLGIRINLPALANRLRSQEIYGNIVLPQGGEVALKDQQPPAFAKADPSEDTPVKTAAAEQAVAAEPDPVEDVDPQDEALIRSIINNMSFMVYYNEETVDDPFLTRTAVGMANRYLSSQGMNYVDMHQIEQIKEDQELAYEAETGQAVSMVQWIANRLNADIYIEVSVDSNTSTRDGRYYGSASVSMRNFDASTAAGRGSAFYQTVPPAMSTMSMDDALNNAVASATHNAIQRAIEQAKDYTQRELVQGIRYDLIITNTQDARLMREFQQRLERRVKSVRRISISPEETRYEVRLIGRIEDLEDIIYSVSDGIPGLDGMYLIFQRGNSITFDSGL